LAAALAEAGDGERAEALARQVCQTLESTGHPDFAVASIALAIAVRREEGSARAYVEAALRAWEIAAWLPAGKARELEEAARSLEAAGLDGEACECRAAAERHWRKLAALPPRAALVP
jgi:hypothetical protein